MKKKSFFSKISDVLFVFLIIFPKFCLFLEVNPNKFFVFFLNIKVFLKKIGCFFSLYVNCNLFLFILLLFWKSFNQDTSFLCLFLPVSPFCNMLHCRSSSCSYRTYTLLSSQLPVPQTAKSCIWAQASSDFLPFFFAELKKTQKTKKIKFFFFKLK